MNFLKRYSAMWSPIDLIVIVFYSFLTVLNIIFAYKLPYWHIFISINIFIVVYVILIAYFEKEKPGKTIKAFHYWYLPPLILLTFKELYFMIKPIREADYDQLLIAADRWIFGGADPTHLFMKIANPVLTEILQIAYTSFFFLPMFLAVSFYLQKRYIEFEYSVYAVVFGFFLSYIGYFMLPGVGPRFTLHDFALLEQELPVLFLTPFFRGVINAGGSVFPWTPDPTEFVQRDVFPSGHTMMTLIVMYLSVKYRSKIKWFLCIMGTLLIISTVYLRYHYVIDLIGGFIFMLMSVPLGKYLFNYWNSKHKRELIS